MVCRLRVTGAPVVVGTPHPPTPTPQWCQVVQRSHAPPTPPPTPARDMRAQACLSHSTHSTRGGPDARTTDVGHLSTARPFGRRSAPVSGGVGHPRWASPCSGGGRTSVGQHCPGDPRGCRGIARHKGAQEGGVQTGRGRTPGAIPCVFSGGGTGGIRRETTRRSALRIGSQSRADR